MSRPYLAELINVRPGNKLYAQWIQYALSFSKDDMQTIINNGLLYQARSIQSMIKEIVGGGAAPPKLLKKLDMLVMATEQKANQLR